MAYRESVGAKNPEAAHQKELRVRAAAIQLVQAYRHAGAFTTIARFIADLEEAGAPNPAIPLTDNMIREETAVDQNEDSVEMEYVLTDDPAALDRWERAQLAVIAEGKKVVAAIRAKRHARELEGR